jgi:hypothetical protein
MGMTANPNVLAEENQTELLSEVEIETDEDTSRDDAQIKPWDPKHIPTRQVSILSCTRFG